MPPRSTRLGSALAALLLLAAVGPAASDELTGTLKKIDQAGTVTIGYRESSLPFSYMAGAKEPIGYAIDICQEIVDEIGRQIGRSNRLAVSYRPVTPESRFAAATSPAARSW